MQFKKKLKNQTWENHKKPNFGPDFGLSSPNVGPQFFFGKIYLSYSLEIVPTYHPMQFKGKPMSQTWENGKKN